MHVDDIPLPLPMFDDDAALQRCQKLFLHEDDEGREEPSLVCFMGWPASSHSAESNGRLC